jgi:hypothetical protein
MRVQLRALLAVCGMWAVSIVPAGAETILSPHAGAAFGGDLAESHASYGVGLLFMGESAGLEIEGNITPHFFGGEDEGLGDNNVTTLMANVLFGTRFGGNGRLYATVGGGLMKSRVQDVDEFFDVSRNDFGVNGGVGAMGFFSGNLGLRGDIKYFRNLSDPEPDDEFDVDFGDFSYWRGTAGIVLRF